MLILWATASIPGSLTVARPELILEGEFVSNAMSMLVCDDVASAERLLLDLDWSSQGRWAALWNSGSRLGAGVVMLIRGRVHDWSSYRYYLAGLRAERLLESNGAIPVFFGPPAKVLRGVDHPDEVSVAISFPSLDAIHGFWESDAYAAIRTRRAGAADLNVGVWRSRH